jgi:hypothetical protein
LESIGESSPATYISYGTAVRQYLGHAGAWAPVGLF